MNFVLDANVLVAAVRSPSGASAEILRRVLTGRTRALCSVPLFMEYAVLLRPERLNLAQAQAHHVLNVSDVLAGVVIRVEIQFLWRPQLRVPNDDLVLELAVNGQGLGEAVTLITCNRKAFFASGGSVRNRGHHPSPGFSRSLTWELRAMTRCVCRCR